jgi:hypothetical protein
MDDIGCSNFTDFGFTFFFLASFSGTGARDDTQILKSISMSSTSILSNQSGMQEERNGEFGNVSHQSDQKGGAPAQNSGPIRLFKGAKAQKPMVCQNRGAMAQNYWHTGLYETGQIGPGVYAKEQIGPMRNIKPKCAKHKSQTGKSL